MFSLSRTQKARLLRIANVRRLVLATLVGAVAGGCWEAAAAVVRLAGMAWPHGWSVPLAIAIPTLAHVLRLIAVRRGWGAVEAHEVPHLAACLSLRWAKEEGADGTWGLPLKVQAAIGRVARERGWVAWSDIDEILRSHGCAPRIPFLGGGCGTERVARRSDFDAAWSPAARLDVACPLPTASTVRRRL